MRHINFFFYTCVLLVVWLLMKQILYKLTVSDLKPLFWDLPDVYQVLSQEFFLFLFIVVILNIPGQTLDG